MNRRSGEILLPVAMAVALSITGCKPGSPSDPVPITLPSRATGEPPPAGFIDMRYYADETAPVLKRQIEDEFKTVLMTKGEQMEKMTRCCFSPGHPDLAAKWDTPTLLMLQKYLALLPAHFYQAKGDGRKTRIILSPYESSNDCFPRGFTGPNDPCVIDLYTKRFNPENPKDAIRLLTHEGAHNATPASLDQNSNIISPWFSKVDAILGGSFDMQRKIIYEALKLKRALLEPQVTDLTKIITLDDKLDEQQTKELFYRRLAYALGHYLGGAGGSSYDHVSPDEFIGVLVEYYIHGKEYFAKRYGEFFTPEQVNKFYEFVRDDIFGGIEYPKFPIN